MWSVSPRFLKALAATPHFETVATCTVPGGTPQTILVKGGSVSVDDSSAIRRTGSLTVFGSAAVYEQLTTLGAVIHIDHGLRFGNDVELVPVFHGEATDGAQQIGAGMISLSLGDLVVRLQRCGFLSPFAPAASSLRVAVIAQVVQDAIPGATVVNASSDTGTIGSWLVWDQSRVDVITDLTKDGGTEAFFLPDGTFLIRDKPDLTAPPTWSANALESADRKRPRDRLYNCVVVRPSATDGSQTWAQQIVEITDVTHPRHKSKIGQVPYIWSSPTAQSADAAIRAGQSILNRVLGTTETLDLGLVSNPALEGGDVLRVITPGIGQEPASPFKHYVDTLSFDLVTASMRLATRSAEEFDA